MSVGVYGSRAGNPRQVAVSHCGRVPCIWAVRRSCFPCANVFPFAGPHRQVQVSHFSPHPSLPGPCILGSGQTALGRVYVRHVATFGERRGAPDMGRLGLVDAMASRLGHWQGERVLGPLARPPEPHLVGSVHKRHGACQGWSAAQTRFCGRDSSFGKKRDCVQRAPGRAPSCWSWAA
jgi:hypothetical protein